VIRARNNVSHAKMTSSVISHKNARREIVFTRLSLQVRCVLLMTTVYLIIVRIHSAGIAKRMEQSVLRPTIVPQESVTITYVVATQLKN